MKSNLKKYFAHTSTKAFFLIGLPLILGSIIYILNDHLPQLLRFYVPDFCWALSLFLTQYYFGLFKKNKYSILGISTLLSVFYEFGQYMHWFSGTFDIFDLLTYQLAFFIAMLLVSKTEIFNHNSKNGK